MDSIKVLTFISKYVILRDCIKMVVLWNSTVFSARSTPFEKKTNTVLYTRTLSKPTISVIFPFHLIF